MTSASPATGTPKTLKTWRALTSKPLGRLAFSAGLAFKAPYFLTVAPNVVSIEPGKSVVRAPNWWLVHNHLGTFHAIAMANLAEVAMGVLLEGSTPPSHRWIPKGMQISYLAKAESGLTATAEFLEPIDWDSVTTGQDAVADISIRDKNGKEVCHAQITTWVSAQPK